MKIMIIYNTWIEKRIGRDARNTTFICGKNSAHCGSIFTSEAASTIDVIGSVEADINGRRARGAVAVVLYTPNVASTVGNPWDYGVKEVLGTCAGRWRLSTTAWGTWIDTPVASLDWRE